MHQNKSRRAGSQCPHCRFPILDSQFPFFNFPIVQVILVACVCTLLYRSTANCARAQLLALKRHIWCLQQQQLSVSFATSSGIRGQPLKAAGTSVDDTLEGFSSCTTAGYPSPRRKKKIKKKRSKCQCNVACHAIYVCLCVCQVKG